MYEVIFVNIYQVSCNSRILYVAERQLKLLKINSNLQGTADSYYKYAISSEWWHKFCDYINVEFTDPKKLFSSANNCDLNRIDLDDEIYFTSSMESIRSNTNQEETTKNELEFKKFIFSSEELYKSPGILKNREIA